VSSVNPIEGLITMPELTLVAPDISCDHCKHTIETGLATLAGVVQVQVEPPAKTVHVVYDEAVVSEPAIRSRLDEIGYPVAV
jgi:copper chaperone